jgi:hypothetical protein
MQLERGDLNVLDLEEPAIQPENGIGYRNSALKA